MVLGSVLVTSAFLSLALAAPILSSGQSCASSCRETYRSSIDYKFEENKSYLYEFLTDSVTTTEGNLRDKSLLRLTGKAEVVNVSPCEYQLSLQNVVMYGREMKAEGVQEIEQKDVLFSYENGLIEHVCPMSDDPPWSVNIKRAILSMLQGRPLHAAKEVHSVTDIHGNCPTSFNMSTFSYSTVMVRKFKDLTRCSEREGIHSGLQTTHYFAPAAIQSIPLLKSSSSCEQKVRNNGIVEDVSCTEIYELRPDIVADSRVSSTVTTNLKYKPRAVSTTRPNARRANRIMSSLKFDHSETLHATNPTEKIKNIIGQICQEPVNGVPGDVPSLFSNLVYEMRVADYRALEAVLHTLKFRSICDESEKAKTIFLDALPLVGTAASVKTMVDILHEEQAIWSKLLSAKKWYASLAFIKHPCEKTVEATYPLIEKETPDPAALLGVSGLVRRLCHEDSECYKKTEVVQLVRKLSKHLGYKCRSSNHDQQTQIITALKALGNIGHMPSDVQSTVKDCINNVGNAVPVRISAIESFRFDPCTVELKNDLIDRLRDVIEDPEIRIASYLGLMKCPCSEVESVVQTIMDEEQVFQVGSFIASHLSNLHQSGNPLKRELQSFIRNINMKKKFPSDLRKFSRNFEWSHYDGEYNTGADLESNLIYSPTSYLPRSAMLNLTVNLFGTSINLFEIGGRVEGLERMVESFFGPKGYFQEKSFNNILKDTQEKISSVGEEIKSRFDLQRSKRSLDEYELASLAGRVKLKEKYEKAPRWDTYLRMFGTELLWSSLTEDNTDFGLDDIIENMLSRLDSTIDRAADFKMDVVRSFMFLDSSVTFPTTMGIPLKLGISGTTSLSINIDNQIDIRRILQDPKNFELKSKIIPSAATQITCTMAADSHFIKSGVKTITNLHTSTAMDLSFRIAHGKMVEFDIGLPREKIELIDMKSLLYKVEQKYPETEVKTEITPTNPNMYSLDYCIDQASGVLGIKFCAKGQTSMKKMNPLHRLFYFPNSLTLTIEKTEPSMRGYHFKTNLRDEVPGEKHFEITFSTPGSTTNRLVSLKCDLLEGSQNKVKLEMSSPWAAFAVVGSLRNDDELKEIKVEFIHSGQQTYSILGRTNIEAKSKRFVYTPLIQMSSPTKPAYKLLDGRVIYVKGRKVDLNLKFYEEKYAIKGNIEVEKKDRRDFLRFSIGNLQLESPQGQAILNGGFTNIDKTYTADFNLQYGELDHVVKFAGKLQDLSAGQLYHFKTSCEMQYSKYPDYNFNMKYEFQKTAKLLENQLTFTHGPNLDQRNQLSILQVTKYDLDSYKDFFYENEAFTLRDIFISNNWALSYKKLNIYISIDHSLMGTSKSLANELEIKYSPEKKVLANLHYNAIDGPRFGYDMKGELSYPGEKFTFTDHMSEVSDGKFVFKTVVRRSPNHQCESSGFYSHLDTEGQYRDEISINLQCDMDSQPWSLHVITDYQGTKMKASVNVEAKNEKQFLFDYMFDKTSNRKYDAAVKWLVKGYLDGEFSSTVRIPEFVRREMNLNLPVLNRRLKGSSEWKMGEMYTFNEVFYWDFDNDRTKKFGVDIKSKVNVDENRNTNVESKAIMEYLDQKTTLNLNYRMKLTEDRSSVHKIDSNSEFSITFPSGKELVLKELVTGTLEEFGFLAINLQRELRLPNGLDLSYIGLLRIPYGVQSYDFESKNTFTITQDERRTSQGVIDVSHVKSDTTRSIGGKLNLSGFGSANPFGFDFKLDTDNNGYQLISISHWSPDDSINLETRGKWQDGTNEENVLNLLLKLRVAGAYDYNFKYETIHKENDERTTMSHTTNVQWNGNSGFDITLNAEPLNWLFKFEKYAPNKARRTLEIHGNQDYTSGSKIENVILIMEGDKVKLKSDFEFKLQATSSISNILLRITMETPSRYYRNADFQLNYEVQNYPNQRLKRDIILKLITGENERSCHISHKVSAHRHEITISVTSPQNSMKINGYSESQSVDNYNVGGRIEWGTEGQYVSGLGSLTGYPTDEFELQLSVDSLLQKRQHWELQASNKLDGGRRRVQLLLKEGAKERFKFSVKYTKEKKRNTVGYRGSVEIKDDTSHEFAFAFEDTEISTRSSEMGHEKTISIQSRGDADLSLELKWKLTNQQFRPYISICRKGKCHIGKISWKDSSTASDNQHYELNLILKRTEEATGSEETRGLRSSYIYRPGSMDQKTEILFHEEKDVIIGYKLYHSSGICGLDMYVPKRTVALQVEYTGLTSDDSLTLITLWLDRKTEPHKKTTLKYISQQRFVSDGREYNIDITFSNPDLQREMSIKYEATYGGQKKLIDSKLYLDIFPGIYDQITVTTELMDKNRAGGHNFTLHTEVKSRTLHTEIDSHFGVNGNLFTTGLNTKYTIKNKKKEWYIMLAGSTNDFYIITNGPFHHAFLKSQWEVHDVITMYTSFLVPGIPQSAVDIQITSNPMIDIKFYNEESSYNYYYVAGGSRNDRTFEIIAQDNIARAQVKEDFNFLVYLNNTKLLYSRLAWEKPENSAGLEKINKNMKNFWREVTFIFPNMINTLESDFTTSMKKVVTLLPRWESLAKHYKQEGKELEDEFENFIKTWRETHQKLYEDINQIDLYVGRKLLALSTAIESGAKSIFVNTIHYLRVISEGLINVFVEIISSLSQIFAEMIKAMGSFLINIGMFVVEVGTGMAKFVQHMGCVILRTCEDVYGKDSYFKSAVDSFYNMFSTFKGWLHNLSDAFESWGNDISSWIYSNEFLRQLIENLKENWKEYKEILQEIEDELEEYLYNSREQFKKFIHEMTADFKSPEIQKAVNDFLDYIDQVFKNPKELSWETITDIGWELYESVRKGAMDLVVFDIENGLIEYHIPLSTDVHSLSELDNFITDKRPLHFDTDISTDITFSPWAAYYKYKPSYNPANWIPPFKAYAMLIGSKHFVTFDKQHYNFAGKCQYVLSRDFVDGNFSVVIDYSHSSVVGKTVLMTDGDNTVEIYPDYKVTLNDNPVDLPCHIEDIRVLRDWDRITVESKKGISLSCDILHDVCILHLSGFYFGKVMGMFGKYNYEEHDEWTLPDGRVADLVETLGHTWKVNRRCTAIPTVSRSLSMDSEGAKRCEKFFAKSSSPLRSCFGVLDRKPWHDMCLDLVESVLDHQSREDEAMACRAAVGYIYACRAAEVNLAMPKECVQCKLSEAHILEKGEVSQLRHRVLKSDTVLVVEQKECNKDTVEEIIPTLFRDLQSDIRQKGFKDNTFALIGYGGPHQEEAEVYTALSEISFSGKTKNMEFGTGGESDMFGALKKATEYPFRVGAAKTIILVSCGICRSADMSVRYGQVKNELLSRGIHLHILHDLPITLASSEKKIQKTIVGYDKDGVYQQTSFQERTLKSDTDLRKQMVVDWNICTELVEEVNGAVFTTDNMLEYRRPYNKKLFSQVMSQRIIRDLEPEFCHKCRCVVDQYIFSRSICTPC